MSQQQPTFIIKSPPWYFWKPQPDITTFELAQCMPMFVAGTIREYCAVEKCFEALPAECKRHWEVKEQGGRS